uniref:Uncharacterized protein n=1 Tax=Strigamia maritima TaxID=126957 RepID=T1J2X1_STRMM
MPITLYFMAASAPCRSVLMLAHNLKLDINITNIDIMAGDQLKPEFTAINPQHTIPTINDEGFILWESRAILCYFANKYGKEDSLYPKDPEKRALVDRMLYFDMGTLYRAFCDFVYPQILLKTVPNPEKEDKMIECLSHLNTYLEKSAHVASDFLTIADFAIFATLITFQVAINFDFTKFYNIARWIELMKSELPFYSEVNQKGIDDFRQWYLVTRP